jgi:hypothetical protein
MNFCCFEKTKRSIAIHLIALTGIICAFSLAADAQRQRRPVRSISPTVDTTSTSQISAPLSGNGTECQNGALASPVQCSGANYTTGSLQKNNSHYFEGDSIPYQITLAAPANSTGNTVTLTWDTSRSGVHALDFLTSYDRTETVANGNDPCTGTGADCALKTTYAIPTDAAAGGHQIAGVFTMFGGTITGNSAYSLSAATGTSSNSITLTFSMGPNAGVAILAVASHASTRTDWGNGNGSVNIQGAPFHFDAGGNSMNVTVGALTAQSTINIVKLVHNLNGTNSNPGVSFSFTSNGGPLGNFLLVDSNPLANAGGVKSATTTNFTQFTVVENVTPGSGYTFSQGACTVDGGGFPVAATASMDQTTRVSTITPAEGNTITCTYENGGSNTTAARVTVAGRVMSSDGRGLSGVKVSLTDARGGTRSVATNAFGYYTFDNVEVGQAYFVSAATRRSSSAARYLALTDARDDVDFFMN